MNLKGIGSVLQFIAGLMGFVGQFTRLANDAKSGAEFVGQRRANNETAGFDTQDRIDLLGAITIGQHVNRSSEQVPVAQKRSNIFENYAGLGEIGNVSNGPPDKCNVVVHERELTEVNATGKQEARYEHRPCFRIMMNLPFLPSSRVKLQ